MVFLLLPIAAIGLLHSSHKKTYKVADITVTFVLLYVTYFLEFYSFGHLSEFQWHGMVAQHSLLGFFARNKRHTWLMGITGCLQCKDLLNQYWCMKPSYSSKDITSLVRDHVKYEWVNYMLDAESYWRFSDIRGHLTLERMECEQVLVWSLDKPFDESILLWHVATDFCFHLKGTQPDHTERSMLPRHVSNYMMHLLYRNSDMLMPGSRMNLFKTAYRELKNILHGQDLQLLDEEKLVQKIVDSVGSREGFIHDSWVLAQGLMQLGDEEKMWEVIKGVWVEMLCFSASRCRGYLHAKGLGSGGEYLSFVWLLMAHAGMETFPERQQRVQLRLPKEERVSIAKQRIQEATRNEAAGVSNEVEIVVL